MAFIEDKSKTVSEVSSVKPEELNEDVRSTLKRKIEALDVRIASLIEESAALARTINDIEKLSRLNFMNVFGDEEVAELRKKKRRISETIASFQGIKRSYRTALNMLKKPKL